MTDIFGIIPDAKPPKGKEGHKQDIFGTWYDPNQKNTPRQPPPTQQHRNTPKQHKPQSPPHEPQKRGYVTESYIQTGKDIVKGVRLGIRGARYLNKKRKEHNAKKNFQITETKEEFKVPERAKDKEFKIKQDY